MLLNFFFFTFQSDLTFDSLIWFPLSENTAGEMEKLRTNKPNEFSCILDRVIKWLSAKFTIFEETINLWKCCHVVIAKKKFNCC